MGLPLRLRALRPRIVLPLLFLLFTGFADPSYEQLCQQGRQHLAQEEYRKAIATFARAIEQQPDKAVAYVGRALAHQAEEDDEAVIADAIMAIDNDKRQTLAYILLADAYMRTD